MKSRPRSSSFTTFLIALIWEGTLFQLWFSIFIFLEVRGGTRAGELSFFYWITPQVAVITWTEAGKTRNQELHLGLHLGSRNPST